MDVLTLTKINNNADKHRNSLLPRVHRSSLGADASPLHKVLISRLVSAKVAGKL